jgi:glucokinase
VASREPRSSARPAVSLGIDIGATKIRAALVDATGRVVEGTRSEPLTDRSPTAVFRAVEDLVAVHLGVGHRPPTSVGVAIAAQVDHERGTVLYAPNLKWTDVPLAAELAKRFGHPVVVENDVRAAAYGEWRVGAARGVAQMVLFWGGTGLGGGLVVDGRLLQGARGAAGELGHLTVVTDGRQCHCPNRGCLEAYVGGWAIAERAAEAIRADPSAGRSLLQKAGRIERVDAELVFTAAASGDPLAARLVAEAGAHLASGAVTVVNALNPSLLLLGGPVLSHWRGLPKALERAIRTRCQPPAAEIVRVREVGLGDWSPIVGAALRAAESVPGGTTPPR